MPALDGLRGVAILLAIFTHVSGGWRSALSIFENTDEWPITFELPYWLHVVSGRAEHGVQLFFLVSAFTLTVRATEENYGVSSYALRRIARVAPGYWLAGIGYTLAAGSSPRLWAPDGVGIVDLIVAAGFASAWCGGASLAVVPGGWSVACEMTFYIMLPFLLWAISGRLWRALLLTSVFVSTAELIARHALITGTWSFSAYVNPVEQVPIFMCGITAAFVAMEGKLPKMPGVAIGLLSLAVCVLPSPLSFGAVSAVVVAMVAVHPPTILAGSMMRRIGEVSYSMYLVHFALLAPSLRMAEWLVSTGNWQTMAIHMAICSIGSFMVACVTYATVEGPVIRWAAARSRA